MKHFYTSLAFKIGGVIILAEILVLTLVGFLYLHRISREMEKRILARIQVPAALMNAGLLPLDSIKDKERMEDLIGGELLEALAVNMEGIVIASRLPARLNMNIADIPDAPPVLFNAKRPEKQLLQGKEHIAAATPVYASDNTPWFFLYIKVGTNLVRSEKYSLFLFFLFGSVGAVVATTIIIITIFNLYILKRISGPLQAIQQLKNGDLTVRVEEDGHGDEITELQSGVNSMTASLREKIRRLEAEITERKRMQREYKKAKEEANNANRARSEFIANMSHEIRTPLNAVSGFSELLSTQITDGRQKSYLDGIKTAGKCLLLLLNDILDLSKIEAGMMKIHHEPVNPVMIFNEIEQIFKVELAAKRLRLIMDIDKDMPATLVFDQTKLRQILVNIVGNAIKFTETGFIKLSSEIRRDPGEREKVDLIIYVQDTGIGIPPGDLETIFESFRQQDGQSTRKYGGTGLGLSIGKRLIEMMNGRITVKSKVEKGSTFKIVLRDIAASPSTGDSDREDDDARGTGVVFKKTPVLVAAGDQADLARTRRLLEEMNLEVHEATNDRDVAPLIRERAPSLVIADVEALADGGVELARKVKETPGMEETPMIALASPGRSGDESEEMDPFDGRLSKPVSKHALVAELSLHLALTESEAPGENAPETPEAPDELAIEEVERLPDLMKILRDEIAPDLEYLKGVMKMSEITKQCDRLNALGKEHQAQGLVNYAEELRASTRSFDIAKIEQGIAEFPGLLEKLERRNTPGAAER